MNESEPQLGRRIGGPLTRAQASEITASAETANEPVKEPTKVPKSRRLKKSIGQDAPETLVCKKCGTAENFISVVDIRAQSLENKKYRVLAEKLILERPTVWELNARYLETPEYKKFAYPTYALAGIALAFSNQAAQNFLKIEEGLAPWIQGACITLVIAMCLAIFLKFTKWRSGIFAKIESAKQEIEDGFFCELDKILYVGARSGEISSLISRTKSSLLS